MLISVILPVFNVEKYIVECIASILNQTIQDYELLIIDDCSTDKTLEMVAGFSDNRIKIITKEKNSGLVDSLNLGMQLAKGKYIARMDGDDISVADRFEKQLQVLENDSNIKACGCWLQQFGIDNEIIKHKEFHHEIMVHMITSCAMSLGSTMFDREWALKFPFDESKKH